MPKFSGCVKFCNLDATQAVAEQIAVEVKSFVGTSIIAEFYKALGQFLMYQRALQTTEPDRILYLALPQAAYD